MKRKVSRGKINSLNFIKRYLYFLGRIVKNIIQKQYSFFILILIGVTFFYFGLAWGKKSENPGEGPINSLTNFMGELVKPGELVKNANNNKPEKVDFDIFWKAWSNVEKKYIDQDELNSQDMVYGAIKGMVDSVGDPYTSYMNPKEARAFSSDMEGSFEGIGAELGMKDGILVVIAPINGMPAEKAGLRAGDRIIKINQEMTSDINIDEAVSKIRGPKGTEVILTVISQNAEESKEIKIIRDTIDLKSVSYEQKWGNIAYIRISSFSEDTASEFNKEITKVIADNNKGIVLDLRNNPGGFLNIAIEMASKFVSRGSVVVQEKHQNGTVQKFESLGGNVFSETPVVILINEGSASASEILAGALSDINGSKLIGQKSFGKGSVQELKEFSDGSSLKITIAEWLTPLGKSINKTGLEADIEVEVTEYEIKNKIDSQLNKALNEMSTQIKNK